MRRSVEWLSGLSLGGSASVGPFQIPVPCAIWSARPTDSSSPMPSFPLVLAQGAETPPGRRAVELRSGSDRWNLEYPVPVPEVSGSTGAAHEAAPGSWVIHWPLSSDQWALLTGARPSLIVLGNGRALLREGEPLVRALQEIRERLGGAPVLWVPRIALPHRLALLVYLGVDLLDTTEARWEAAEGVLADASLGRVEGSPARAARLCECSDCARNEPPGTAHVALTFSTEFARVRTALAEGRLRELVEARLTAEPMLAELLRYADQDLGPLLEERTPVVSSSSRGYVLRESQRRPEVRRFLDRLIERYRPPPSKEILLVLPCSKTKPYRASPSHRRYLGALDGVAHPYRVHVVSVTSPLGIVPRELEDVYPARHYDIPVTGEWDEEERQRVIRALTHLRRTGRYRRVVFHLDPTEYEFLRPVEAASEGLWTSPDEHTLGSEALQRLRTAIDEELRSSTSVPGGPLSVVREELHEVAAYQFGRAAADRLFAEPVRLAGRPWFQRLMDGDRIDLASWKEERGLFQLTVAGGRRMLESHPLEVQVGPEVPLAGDLFVPGVVRADPQIRVGDAVLLTRDSTLLGVGEAELPGRLMTELGHGLAVTVRHRAAGVVARPTGT